MGRWRAGLATAAVAGAAGCTLPTAGNCSHAFLDPVVSITAATSQPTGQGISTVLLTDVRVGGTVVPVGFLLNEGRNATARGDTLVCGIPCGFGTTEGRYQATISAPGHVSRGLAFTARYQTFHGGCPSFNSGSTTVTLSLDRVAGS